MTKRTSNKMNQSKPLGFWSCWALTVGIMIGSGIFLLPASLVKFGLLSFWGWGLTALGSVALALVIARLSNRTTKSGAVFQYTRDAFGDFPSFLVAWAYWASYWIAIPAMAIAFVGYLSVFVPAIKDNAVAEATAALILIWAVTLINLRGLAQAGRMQIVMTLLKLIPLLVIVALGAFAGTSDNLPELNPQGGSVIGIIAASALLTMWAFSGMEAGAVPAADVVEPERTIPRAILFGTLVVAFVYIASSYAVMSLVPAEQLANSTSPFADAAQGLGSWGPTLVAIGAMISTAGAINGTIFLLGQLPMAVAVEGLAHPALAKRNRGGAPAVSLILASLLGSILLIANYNKGLLEMFELLVVMSTSAYLVPMLVCGLAELKASWRAAKGWGLLALFASVYSGFAIYGSGLDVLAWGIVLFAAGIPLYFWGRQQSKLTSSG